MKSLLNLRTIKVIKNKFDVTYFFAWQFTPIVDFFLFSFQGASEGNRLFAHSFHWFQTAIVPISARHSPHCPIFSEISMMVEILNPYLRKNIIYIRNKNRMN